MKTVNKLRLQDNAFLFVSLFCLVGGFSLYRSYAAKHKQDTYVPGVYRLVEFKTNSGWRLNLSVGREYCFDIEPSSGYKQASIKDSVGETTYDLYAHEQAVCFRPTMSHSQALVTLPTKVGVPKTLVVY